jgi:hypothetical protein
MGIPNGGLFGYHIPVANKRTSEVSFIRNTSVIGALRQAGHQTGDQFSFARLGSLKNLELLGG